MKLYIMRHGETDWNIEKRMQGKTDIPLNENGRRLAKLTGEALRDIDFDRVYSSPLSRAMETAKLVLDSKKVEIIVDKRLEEMGFGEYEGRYPDERPENFKDFFEHPDRFIPGKGGESYEELCARTEDFIKTVILPLAVEHPDFTILISGHGAMDKALLKFFKGIPISEIWSGVFMQNCCITIVDIDSKGWSIEQENTIFY